jgi:flagellin-like protein
MAKGISPVVATVLLITIAVIAGTTTWYWVSSYTSKPALPGTSLSGYIVTGVYKNPSKTGCIALDIKNIGGQTITNVGFYIKDYKTGKVVGSNGTDPSYPAYINVTNLAAGNTAKSSISSFGTTTFLETNLSNYSVVNSVAIGDVNNDGKNEIVADGGSVSELMLFENKSGGWVKTNITYTDNFAVSIAIGDANNDGSNETVIAILSTPNQTRMYKNTTGKWVETNISDEPERVTSVVIGDANNDGKNEVLVGMWSTTNELRMYENKSGKWVETNISDEPNDVNSIAIGDVNNDGKNEVIVGLYSDNNETRMYENKSGKWVETNISDEPTTIYSVAIGDANNDGKNETVIGMVSTNNEVRMYQNVSGGWVETNISDEPGYVLSVAIGDANNDGSNEVAVTFGGFSGYNKTRMYQNMSGKWVETNISDMYGAVDVYCVAIGDVNNDGQNEVVIGGDPTYSLLRFYSSASGASSSILLGTYVLRTSTPGFSDQIFTCA